MATGLRVQDLSVSYGPALILHEASLQVGAGDMVSLVGPNGAGKTTLLRALSGLVRWEQHASHQSQARLVGEVRFGEERVDRLPAYEIAARGLILCPERRRPFREMNVEENLRAGAYLVRSRKGVRQRLDEVYDLFPVLRERSRQRAGTLSGGEQQMLAIGRALMTGPKLLLIDEPSTGLAPLVKRPLFERIGEIKARGLGILLVEQDAELALSMANSGYVLSQGRIVAEGSPEELLADEVVRRSYLGL
ncbi:MAG: ABC transporter ATP-binding protein [Candidatus Bipolaricaulota bacterium]